MQGVLAMVTAKNPLPGEPKLGTVYFLDKQIKDHPKMKTLKEIMRANWPITGIDFRREFIDKCVRNFYEYYDYPHDMTKEEGDNQVEIHTMSNIRQNMFSDKDKADKKVKKYPGTTRRDFVPKHLDPLAWEAFRDYWETSDFQNRSATNKNNRSHKKLKHTTGSTAIGIFQENWRRRRSVPWSCLRWRTQRNMHRRGLIYSHQRGANLRLISPRLLKSIKDLKKPSLSQLNLFRARNTKIRGQADSEGN